MECRKQEAQRDAPPPRAYSNADQRHVPDDRIPDHSRPREPFYHPAGDPRIQTQRVSRTNPDSTKSRQNQPHPTRQAARPPTTTPPNPLVGAKAIQP